MDFRDMYNQIERDVVPARGTVYTKLNDSVLPNLDEAKKNYYCPKCKSRSSKGELVKGNCPNCHYFVKPIYDPKGANESMNEKKKVKCAYCGGDGRSMDREEKSDRECAKCKGTGKVYTNESVEVDLVKKAIEYIKKLLIRARDTRVPSQSEVIEILNDLDRGGEYGRDELKVMAREIVKKLKGKNESVNEKMTPGSTRCAGCGDRYDEKDMVKRKGKYYCEFCEGELDESVEVFLKENTGITPQLLIMAGHKPENVKYVWYCDSDSKKVVGSFKAGSHDNNEFANITKKEDALRGRVFELNGKTFLIIYGKVAGMRDPSNEEVRDIYLQVSKQYPENIDYVVDEEGEELKSVLESVNEEGPVGATTRGGMDIAGGRKMPDEQKAEEDDEDAVVRDPEDEEKEPEVENEEKGEEEDKADVEDGKEYLGNKGSDDYFYLMTEYDDADKTKTLFIADANGEVVVDAKENQLETDDVKGLVELAIKELELSNVSSDIITKYLLDEPEESGEPGEEVTGQEEDLSGGPAGMDADLNELPEEEREEEELKEPGIEGGGEEREADIVKDDEEVPQKKELPRKKRRFESKVNEEYSCPQCGRPHSEGGGEYTGKPKFLQDMCKDCAEKFKKKSVTYKKTGKRFESVDELREKEGFQGYECLKCSKQIKKSSQSSKDSTPLCKKCNVLMSWRSANESIVDQLREKYLSEKRVDETRINDGATVEIRVTRTRIINKEAGEFLIKYAQFSISRESKVEFMSLLKYLGVTDSALSGKLDALAKGGPDLMYTIPRAYFFSVLDFAGYYYTASQRRKVRKMRGMSESADKGTKVGVVVEKKVTWADAAKKTTMYDKAEMKKDRERIEKEKKEKDKKQEESKTAESALDFRREALASYGIVESKNESKVDQLREKFELIEHRGKPKKKEEKKPKEQGEGLAPAYRDYKSWDKEKLIKIYNSLKPEQKKEISSLGLQLSYKGWMDPKGVELANESRIDELKKRYLMEQEDKELDPRMLRSVGHKKENVKLVWWYNMGNGDFRASEEKINHTNKLFSDIAHKPGWISGRVFEYNGKLFLIIYLRQGFSAAREGLTSLLHKVKSEYDLNPDYIIDSEGKDITELLEGLDESVSSQFNFTKFKGIKEKKYIIEQGGDQLAPEDMDTKDGIRKSEEELDPELKDQDLTDVEVTPDDVPQEDVPETPAAQDETAVATDPETAKADLQLKYPEEPMTSTSMAYADSLIDDPAVYGALRDLQWQGVYANKDTFLKQVKIVGDYNEFNSNIAKQLTDKFGDSAKYKLAREGSVAVYVTVRDTTKTHSLEALKELVKASEVGTTANPGEVRLWWD